MNARESCFHNRARERVPGSHLGGRIMRSKPVSAFDPVKNQDARVFGQRRLLREELARFQFPQHTGEVLPAQGLIEDLSWCRIPGWVDHNHILRLSRKQAVPRLRYL